MAIKINPDIREKLHFRHLYLHDGVLLHPPVTLEPPVRIYTATLNRCRVGAFSYISPGCVLHETNIGRYCSIGDSVQILSQHPTDRLTTHPITYQSIFPPPFDVSPSAAATYSSIEPTYIGNDVWIGSGVRIKSGVHIGDGAIVAAGAVVTKDIAPFAVVGGVPAKIIRMRFDKALLDRLQQVQWWQFNLLGLALEWGQPGQALEDLQSLVDKGEVHPYNPPWVELK